MSLSAAGPLCQARAVTDAPSARDPSALCLACGLCCNGAFHDLVLLDEDELDGAARHHLPIAGNVPFHAFRLPCPTTPWSPGANPDPTGATHLQRIRTRLGSAARLEAKRKDFPSALRRFRRHLGAGAGAPLSG